MVFSLTGFTHVNRNDFRTTRGKYRVLDQLEQMRENVLGDNKREDLSRKDRMKFDEYSDRIDALQQQIQVETMYHKLNPDSPNFEKDFNRLITEPMNKGIKAVVPEFEGVKVKFGRGS